MGKEIEALINHAELTEDLIEVRIGSEDILSVDLEYFYRIRSLR